MNDTRGPGHPPNRWLRCPRKASDLIADKFIAFKTPLCNRFDAKVPPEYRFQPSMLFYNMNSYKVELGLWIDLTNTSKYYDKEDVERWKCKYVKIPCCGHGETPSKDQTQNFIKLVKNFIEMNPLKVIGVHCTHGFNRTGFLICSFLVEEYSFSVDAALARFSKVRTPGIYKEDYIRELYERYDDVEDAPPPPDMPDWCIEYDDSTHEPESSGFENHAETSDSTRKRKRKREFQNKNPVFMAGVPGVQPITDLQKLADLQKTVQDMCGWFNPGFPGSQPVSMDVKNLKLLGEKPYRVSWKADGTRYMMYIEKKNNIYFFDRDNSVFQVDGLTFPHRKNIDRHIVDTLLDGEMVIDKVNGQNIPRYLAYDIIKFNGSDISKLPFYPLRLKCIECDIVGPRHHAMREGRIDRAREPFSIRNKEFWDLTQAGSLLGPKFAKNLSHEPDGLIFQPSSQPYVPGRCDEVLKWKPLCMNSVDFKLQLGVQSGKGLVTTTIGNLYVGQLDRPYSTIKLTRLLRQMNNKIIECKYENNEWVFMRERTDKSFPNSYVTASAVHDSIKNPVTTEKLLEFIQNNRYRNDSELMPSPNKMPRT